MDNYTKQVDCPEIQEKWEPKVGDRIATGYRLGPCGDDYNIIDWDFGIFELSDMKHFLMGRDTSSKIILWLPRQEDWQNILFREHYAPAIPTAKTIHAAIIIMHREHVDYMEGWKIDQPCEAWARLYMNFQNKTWEKGEWEDG